MKNISAIIVDIHAECTSEKKALEHYIDGRASALVGSHTHIQTNDFEVTKKGLGYIKKKWSSLTTYHLQ